MSGGPSEAGADRQPTEGGSGTAEVESADDQAGEDEGGPAGGEQKKTERSDEL